MSELSIIIPIFNAEMTLERCVQSVTSQSYDDWEVILVDDGSTDGSANICDILSQKYERIRVIHKKNGGSSDARNAGVANAQGKYITFLDSDDEYAPDMLGALMSEVSAVSECDVVEYPAVWNRGAAYEKLNNFKNRKYVDFLSYWKYERGYEHCWTWNKIFKAWIFDKIRFRKDILFEDVEFMGQLAELHPVIRTVAVGMYYYNYNVDGISKQYDERLLEMLRLQLKIVERLSIDLHDKEWHHHYMTLLNTQIDVFVITRKILLPDVRVKIRKYNNFISLLKSIMVRFAGVRNTCLLLSILKKKIMR